MDKVDSDVTVNTDKTLKKNRCCAVADTITKERSWWQRLPRYERGGWV